MNQPGMSSKLKFNVNQNIVKLTLPLNAIHTHCEEDFVWSSLGTFEYNDDCLEEPKPHVIEV